MTEKSLKHHILEYCKFINEHENTFYIQSEADDEGCVKYKSFIFGKSPKSTFSTLLSYLDTVDHFVKYKPFTFGKSPESTFQTLLSYFDNPDTGIVDHFVLKYHYKNENYSSPIQCNNHTPNLDYVIFSSPKLNETNLIRNGSKRYQFFTGIINELEEYFEKYKKEHGKDSFTKSKELSRQYNTTVYEIDRIHYGQINPLKEYCTKQQHELMGGNYSSLAITKENFERFTSEFCALINDSDALKSLARDQTFKEEYLGSGYGAIATKKLPISENFSIRHDDITYPFKLRYVCGSNCHDNSSYVELYPYHFEGNSLKFTTDKNFSLFMGIRDHLREISKKGEYYLSDKKREPIKKSCNKFEKDLPTRIENKHKKTDLNITNNKSLIGQITNSNRTNGIVPHYLNSTNISTKPDFIHFNNVTNTNSLIATDVATKPGLTYFLNNTNISSSTAKNSTEIQTSSWLIAAGGVISLLAIGIFAMFKWKRSRNIKNQSFDLKRKSSGTNQEHSSFIPPTSVTVQADSANQEKTEVLENRRPSNINKKEFRIHTAIMQKESLTEKKATNPFKRTNTHRLAPLAEIEEDGDVRLMMITGDELITSTFMSNTLLSSNLGSSSTSIESSIPDSIYSKAEGTNLIDVRCTSFSTLSLL